MVGRLAASFGNRRTHIDLIGRLVWREADVPEDAKDYIFWPQPREVFVLTQYAQHLRDKSLKILLGLLVALLVLLKPLTRVIGAQVLEETDDIGGEVFHRVDGVKLIRSIAGAPGRPPQEIPPVGNGLCLPAPP